MKKSYKKKVFSVLFYFGVLALTLWYVFRNENPAQIFGCLENVNLWLLIPAMLAVLAFILGESVNIYYLLKKLEAKPRFFQCCLYSFIGFFYSAITPSASGGQPMQLIAMRRAGIRAAVSAVVLAIVTITYKMVLVVIGVAVLVFRPEAVVAYLGDAEPLIYLGLVLNVGFIALLLMVVFYPAAIRGALQLLFSLGEKIRPFRNKEKAQERLENIILQYQGTAEFFKTNPKIIAHVFLVTMIQRFLLFSVIWFTYMAFGLSGTRPLTLVLLYGMISVAADMMPLPGGMGISESLFLMMFGPIFGENLVVPGMIVARGISYYTQLLISTVMTGVAHVFFHFQRKKTH